MMNSLIPVKPNIKEVDFEALTYMMFFWSSVLHWFFVIWSSE